MPTLPLSKTEIANQSKPFGGAPKPWRIDSVIETRKLKVQLEAAALDHMPQDKELRDRAMDLLHGALFRGRMIAQERLNAGIERSSVIVHKQAERNEPAQQLGSQGCAVVRSCHA